MVAVVSRVGSAHSHPTPDIDTIIQFLSTIYRGQAGGFFEICFIAGDPSDSRERAKRYSWQRWQPTDPEACVTQLTQLAARYGDVYVSRTCYDRDERNAVYALPSYALVADDAPLDGDYTFVVETSRTSRHGWRMLDQALAPSAIAELGQRAAYAEGSDRSGWDVTQLVRVPGGTNTKRGQHWPVRWLPGSDCIFNVDDLLQRWPSVTSASPTTPIANQDVCVWRGNVEALLNAAGIPRRLKPTARGAQILQGRKLPQRRDGSGDDYSQMRYTVICSLILHGYPDAETQALAEHLCDYNQAMTKGTRWLDADIARCISKARSHYPHVTSSPTRFLATTHPPVDRVIVEPQRTGPGRPMVATADQLLCFYLEHKETRALCGRWQLPLCRREAAAQFGVSLPTLDRLERVLRQRGELTREMDTGRQWSFVDLGPIPRERYQIIQEDYTAEVPSKIPSAAEADGGVIAQVVPQATHKEHTPPQQDVPSVVIGEDPAGSSTPGPSGGVPSMCPTLAEMVGEALDAQPGLYHRHTSTKLSYLAAYIAANYGLVVKRERLTILFDQMQKGRRRDQDRVKLAAMPTDKLYAEQHKRQKRQDRACADGNERQVSALGWQVQRVADELHRRQLPLDRPKAKRRRPQPAERKERKSMLGNTVRQQAVAGGVTQMIPLVVALVHGDSVTGREVIASTEAERRPPMLVDCPGQALMYPPGYVNGMIRRLYARRDGLRPDGAGTHINKDPCL